jgi:hypothetical protein
MPEPDHVLAGERVALGPLRKDLAETYACWINDLDVRRGLANPALLAVEARRTGSSTPSARAPSASPSRSTSRSTTARTARRWGRLDAVPADFKSPVVAARRSC